MNEPDLLQLTSYVAGDPIESEDRLDVFNPYDGQLVGTVTRATPEDAERAVQAAVASSSQLSRYQRSEILLRTREALIE